MAKLPFIFQGWFGEKPVKFSTFRPYFASPGVTWGPTWSAKGLAKSRSRGSKGKTKPSISPSKPHLAWILIFWWNTGCYSVTSWGFAKSPVGVSYLALTMTSLRSGRLTIVYGYWLILDWRGWLATSVLGGWLVLAWEVEYCMGKLASLRLGRLTCVWRNWLVLDWGGWQVLDQEGWLVLHWGGWLVFWGSRLVVERPAGVCNRPADSSGLSLSPGKLPGGGQSGVLHWTPFF